MALTAGTRLGNYDVTALIGEGGIGQVYQARDTTLDRDVALQVLPRHSRPTLTGWPASSAKPRCSPR
jgi:hypothetical protein